MHFGAHLIGYLLGDFKTARCFNKRLFSFTINSDNPQTKTFVPIDILYSR